MLLPCGKAGPSADCLLGQFPSSPGTMARANVLPPVARKIPKRLVAHGDVRIDNYFWMKNRTNPEVMRYIKAENRYTAAMMMHTDPLQRRLFAEFRSRVIEEDSSVPTRIDEYLYYSRLEKGGQHPVFCRKKADVDSAEEVVLDVNKLARGTRYFNLEMHKVSPDHRLVAYLIDTKGSERNSLFVREIASGRLVERPIENTAMVEWANDSSTLFYATKNELFMADKVYRHLIGERANKDELVYHEKDRSYYYMSLERTKSRKYIVMTTESPTTSEVRYLDADHPAGDFRTFAPRRHGVEYFVFHNEDRFFIVTNEGAPNFKIMSTPVDSSDKRNWKEVLPHRGDTAIDVSYPHPWVEVFRDYIAVFEMKNANGQIRILRLSDSSNHVVRLPEKMGMIRPDSNPIFDSHNLRFRYSSFVTPPSVYEYDMNARRLVLRKQDKVKGHTPSRYVSERIQATAPDGTKIPISLVYKKGLKKPGGNPGYLYAYGAYGDFETGPSFDICWLSLLDRGFVCAVAHVRGSGDLGKKWHDQGRVLNKINTFTDYIACAEHLIRKGYVAAGRLAAEGRSAGGLLMGAVTTMRPDLFKVVIAGVPFIDAITTELDDTIPLSEPEWEEWGNPRIRKHYLYFKKYSPYDRVEGREYPNILITAGWNDSRVQYWEPTKFAAKLRELKTDSNLLLLKTDFGAGHHGTTGRFDVLKDEAFLQAFILDRLGIKR